MQSFVSSVATTLLCTVLALMPSRAAAMQPDDEESSEESTEESWDDESESSSEPSDDAAPAADETPKRDAAEESTGKSKSALGTRKWGLGAGIGGIGVQVLYAHDQSGEKVTALLPAFELLSFEARVFLKKGHSIDISVPVITPVLYWALIGGAWVTADVFYNFNLGKKNVRLLAGPGLGFWVYALPGGNGALGGVRIPGVIGAEFLTLQHRLGLQLALKPWVMIGGGKSYGESGLVINSGALLTFGMLFYKLVK